MGRLQDRIETVFSADGIPFKGEVDTLYLIGGAWRNLALIHQARTDYPLRMAQNYAMDTAEALQLATWTSSDEGREILSNWSGLSKRRLDTLPYSGLMMEDLIARFYPQKVVFAAAGLREGLIADSLGDTLLDRNALFDACRAFRQSPMTGFGLSLKAFIDSIDADIPAQFDAATETRLRQAACLLASTGAAKHPDHRADLVFQDVLYSPLPALNHQERAYIAQIVFSSFTGRNTTPNEAAMTYLLTDDARQSARTYGYAMRLGATICARSPKVLNYFDLQAKEGCLSLTVETGQGSLLTEVAEIRLKKLASIAGFADIRCETEA